MDIVNVIVKKLKQQNVSVTVENRKIINSDYYPNNNSGIFTFDSMQTYDQVFFKSSLTPHFFFKPLLFYIYVINAKHYELYHHQDNANYLHSLRKGVNIIPNEMKTT